MGSETKVGLLVGMCFIVCFAIILAHRGAPEKQTLQGIADNTAASESPENRDANQDAETDNRQATRRVDDLRKEPSARPFQLQPRRYANGPSNDSPNDAAASNRFRRRSAPLPAPRTVNRVARTGRRSAPAQTFEEGFANALANAGQSTDREAAEIHADRRQPAEPAQRSTGDFLQAARPLLDAGRQMADALADAGYELSRQAQLEQAKRRAEAEAARSATSRNPLTTAPRRPERASASRGVHLVKSGDNLTRIARQVYQDDSKHVIDAIYDANRSHMDSPDHLVVGREIILPELDGRSTTRRGDERIADRTTVTRHPETPRGRSDPETQTAARQLREDLAKLRDDEPESRDGREPSDRANEPATSREYVVEVGDTLIRIVRASYGTDDPAVVQRVFAANRDRLAGPDAIRVGQTLMLPGAAPSRGGRANDSARTRKQSATWRWYQLQKGDLYTTVAQEQLGAAKRWRELAELNADIFPDPSRIRYGVRIRIPIDRDASLVALNRRGARR